MLKTNSKVKYKKIAFALSVLFIVIWCALGTGASLAWFNSTSNDVKNIFNVAEFDLEVSKRVQNGNYIAIEGNSSIFDEAAVYEPGYVQVVYLKATNNGSVPFDLKTAVTVASPQLGTNRFGRTFDLQDYLKFGLIADTDETSLLQKTSDRVKTKAVANMRLNNYATGVTAIGAGESIYIALIVSMPEETDNEANYSIGSAPYVDLGITVTASQQNINK